MASINNYYIFVKTEEMQYDVDVSSHPVEQGLPVTDNIRRKPIVLNLTGKIVANNGIRNYADVIKTAILNMYQSGQIVNYRGKNLFNSAVIKSFRTSNSVDLYGGYAFTMILQEIRFAHKAYIKGRRKTKSGTKQVTKKANKRTYTVKKGDTLASIAKFYYGNGNKWTTIYNANKSLIKNANVIKIGWKLVIP